MDDPLGKCGLTIIRRTQFVCIVIPFDGSLDHLTLCAFIQLCRLSQFHSALQTLTVLFSFADSHNFIHPCRLPQFHAALQTLAVSFCFADCHSFIQLCILSQFHSALQTLTVSFSFADSVSFSFADSHSFIQLCRRSQFHSALQTLAHRGSTVGFLLLQCSSGVVRHSRDLQVSVATRFCRVLIFASSYYLSVIYLFHVMFHWWVRKPPRGPNNCMFWAMIEAEGEVGRP